MRSPTLVPPTQDPAPWFLENSREVLDRARSEISCRAAGLRQRELLRRALETSNCARLPHRYHASLHLPLLVHAGATGDDAAAVPLAAACTLLWAGAELYDDLTDGDLDPSWQQSAPFEIIFAATAAATIMPQAIVASLAVPWDRREGMLSDLGDGLLRMFEGQASDLALTGANQPDPAQVETSVVGKNGAPKAIFAGLAARMAGVSPDIRRSYMAFAAALGVIYQLQSDHFELFFAERCRDLEHGTRTLQIAVALQVLPEPDREELLTLLRRARSEPDVQERVRRVLRRADVMRPWVGVLRRYVQEAEQSLEKARPHDPAGRILRQLIADRSPRCA